MSCRCKVSVRCAILSSSQWGGGARGIPTWKARALVVQLHVAVGLTVGGWWATVPDGGPPFTHSLHLIALDTAEEFVLAAVFQPQIDPVQNRRTFFRTVIS